MNWDRSRAARTAARDRMRRFLLPLGLAAIAVLTLPSAAGAAIFPVTGNGDEAAGAPVNDGTCTTDGNPAPPNVCTLRAAIQEANGTGGGDEIQFTLPTPATITLGGT